MSSEGTRELARNRSVSVREVSCQGVPCFAGSGAIRVCMSGLVNELLLGGKGQIYKLTLVVACLRLEDVGVS